MKTISAILLLSLTVSTTPAIAKTSTAQMPKAIQGTWYPNSSEGKKQCAAYRQKKDNTTRISALIIAPKYATEANPNGEDETYELQKVTNLSRQSWKLSTTTIFAGEEGTKTVEVRARLKQGQLYWSNLPENRYFKCL
jgi:hypothetical protein